MRPEDFIVEVRNADLARVGQIQPELLNLKAGLAYNNVGNWTLQLPADHRLATPLRTPGAGLIVYGPDDVLFSGPAIMPSITWSSASPRGLLTITGVTDEIHLADRLAWPDPANSNPTTQAKARDKRSGSAESVIHGYVNANAGPGAPTVRRVPNLVMGTNGGRGGTVTKSARFDQLGAFIADIAKGATLGFRVVQRGDQLVFETYEVLDRSAYVRLDVWSNSLQDQLVSIQAPTATQVIVGGDGEGENRVFVSATSDEALAAQDDWSRRIERFIDHRQSGDSTKEQADTLAEANQKAKELLAVEGLTIVSAKATAADDTSMRFAHNWFLGDRVGVMLDTGEIDTVVTGANITVDSDGAKVGVILGDPDAVNPDFAFVSKHKVIEKRVSQLERNGDSGTSPPGMVRLWGSSSIPSGWLLCNGASYSRTAYAGLFAVIGTTYGSTTSSTFKVPSISSPQAGTVYAIKT